MSQTTLNLVAITIFTLVMSSLLGPLVNLSPVVPAIAVFGLLGVATLDTISWQGRGGTLLIDWLARFSPQHRERVIRHEAGHFLVAHLLEISITGYTLSAWEAFRQGQPGLGGVSFDSQELNTELEKGILSAQLVERYCTVWMAGTAAEKLVYGNAEGGADDRQKLRILWTQLKRPLSECETKERWASLQARSLLEAHQPAYEKLVTAMTQAEPVSKCRELIEQAINS
ncbi:MAG: ATP-dependent Zn protease [Leptolyngbyaceae cyanobacterium SM1_4_3]|nr:ATP-dependent Zn protease [Leptolyngbyaceae cyanobacterium SM1_4_3]NJN92087.1 ATP-dependent Zn protease [Leptolyngbyaceae cyanobacterium SL_5_14]